MKIFFACHKHPYHANGNKPGGGEHSVRIIMQHFLSEGHEVRGWHIATHIEHEIKGVRFFGRHENLKKCIEWADVVLTWGNAAPIAADEAIKLEKPFILMVRWWRNVAPIPAGDLMTRNIPSNFRKRKQFLFDHAAAVVTNNHYAAKAILKHYGVLAHVSYVPIPGRAECLGDSTAPLVLVSPNKNIGEFPLMRALLPLIPERELLVVNADANMAPIFTSYLPQTKRIPHTADMREVWAQSSILLSPVYHNDICGTTRVVIEAMQHGVPVIANERCGMGEKVPARNLVERDAGAEEWRDKIAEVLDDYEARQREALEVFSEYDTAGQLEIFSELVQKAALCNAS